MNSKASEGSVISERLKQTMLTALDLDDFPFDDESTAGMVPGWDSLSHVTVIAAVEKEYDLHFKTTEILRLKRIKDLQDLVDRKLSEKSVG